MLGWHIGNGEIQINPSKSTSLREWPLNLKNKLHVQKTMGILNYIQSSIKGYAKIARPINNSIKKENELFIWTDKARVH